MQRATLSCGLSGILVALAAVGLAGCGPNEAPLDRSDRMDGPGTAEPATASVDSTAPVERERALGEREALLDAREAELEGREDRLEQRSRRIDARSRTLDKRETELAEREAALDRGDTRDLAVPFEPEPVPRPVPAARSVVVTLPSATAFEVEFDEELSSETSLVGDGVRAIVARDVVREGLVAVPAGSTVWGTVVAAVPGKDIGGQASLALRFDTIDVASGESIPVEAFLDLAGRRQTKKDAATIGGSAAGGALLGRVLSDKKGKGTAIGAILGAAVGAAVASGNAGDPVVIEPGTTAELVLEAPVDVAVAVGPERVLTAER